MPTENGQPADLVIGQKDFFEIRHNRGGEASACTLNDPYGLFLEEDDENEEDIGKLFIADRGNSRVVIWEEIPEPPKKDEEEEEERYDFQEDENVLMGEDDDYKADLEEAEKEQAIEAEKPDDSEDPALT